MHSIWSAQDVIRCDLCKTALVQMYCDFCHVNLCRPCIGEHIADEYDKHKIVPFQHKKSTLIYPTCSVHQTKGSEFHCETCKTSVCSLCALSDTHRGHVISALSDLFYLKRKNIKNDTEELENSISPTYAEIENEIETQIANLDGEYGNLTTTLIKCGVEWHREVDSIVEKLRIEIEKEKSNHEHILKEHLNEIKQIQTLIKQTLLNISQIEDSNDVSLTMEYISRTKELSNLPPKVQISLPTFSSRTIDTEQFHKLFGCLTPLSVTTEKHGYEVKKPKISTKDKQEAQTGDKKLLVAGIAFGTTNSGLAFSYSHDYKKDPLNVNSINLFTRFRRSVYPLTNFPTCFLFNKDRVFDSFGYDAEDKYSELTEEKKHEEWYYFKRLNMSLFNKENALSNAVKIKSIDGKEMVALDVFSAVIKSLKSHLLRVLEKKDTEIKEIEIQWVLTASAIWNDPARQFMREAAVRAGIYGDQVLIALEPEMTLLYCKHLPVEKLNSEGGAQGFRVFSEGSKYLVLDCGGEKVDFTVYKVQTDHNLKKLYKASVEACGGNLVDEAYKQMLISIVGAPVLAEFARSHTADYLDLYREFETRKLVIKGDTKGKVGIKLPVSLLETFEENTGEDFKEAIEKSKYSGKITLVADKFRIAAEVMKSFFEVAGDQIVDHVRDLINKPEISGTNNIIMVGGFSESPILQDMIKQSFPDMRVIIPPEPRLAVLKGVVLFGHKPVPVCSYIDK